MRDTSMNDACRDCRRTLLLYRDSSIGHPVNMNGCFDHALVCGKCYVWAGRNGFEDMLKKYATEKMQHMTCPVCSSEMKLNFAFSVAKCLQCDLELCWADPLRMAMSIMNMAEIMRRRAGKKGVADYMLSGLPPL